MEGYSDMLREAGVPWTVRRLLEESATPCTIDIEMTGELKMRLQVTISWGRVRVVCIAVVAEDGTF
jgi:hypothetical protein